MYGERERDKERVSKHNSDPIWLIPQIAATAEGERQRKKQSSIQIFGMSGGN